MAVLYQFTISHYCEKARWAMDYKGFSYTTKNLMVGMHIKPVRKIAPQSSVPVVVLADRTIQGSDRIVDYLDDILPERPLTPARASQTALAREWESHADTYFGVPVRCLLYHVLLDYPDILIPMWAAGGPFYGKLFYRISYAKLCATIRRYMKINAQSAAQSKVLISEGLQRVAQQTARHGYLAGDRFSRADLAVAALLSPLLCPAKSGYGWHRDLPEELHDFRQAVQATPAGAWVNTLYQNYR